MYCIELLLGNVFYSTVARRYIVVMKWGGEVL